MPTTAPLTLQSADLDEVRRHLAAPHRDEHFYVALLGLRSYEPLRIYQNVRRGLSYSAFEHLQRNTGLAARAIGELAQIPARTLARRRGEGRFDPEESDRLVRLARIFGRALELFEGDPAEALRWLSSAQVALGGMVPLDLARTDVGAREVESLVGRLEHGIPA